MNQVNSLNEQNKALEELNSVINPPKEEKKEDSKSEEKSSLIGIPFSN